MTDNKDTRNMAGELRKQAKKALQAELDRAYQYLDIAGVIIVCIASDQTITLINRKGCKVLGYTQEELIGKNWFDLVIAENERQMVTEVFAKLMKGELEPAEHFENFVIINGGEKRLIHWHNTLLKDKDGNITGTLSSGEDITERRQAEEALKNSEERYRTLYEYAPVLIDAFEENGRCTMWNQECQRVFGWTIDEINAHAEPLELFYPDPDIRREVMYSVTSQPGKIFREWHPLTKDGKELTVLWANFHIPNGTVINIGRDITERKRLDEEQQKVAKLESIGILAAGIAHNFNNILTVILGNIEIAKMDANQGSETREVLDQAEKASLRAKDLTAQLLTFSKGGWPVKKITSLAELIRDAADSALAGSNVKCHFSIHADLRQAEIDAVQIRQVISNLAINARQAMPAGGTVELFAENMTAGSTNGAAKESTLKAGDYIMISVTDHGSGIPEKNMGKIFDPFFTTKIGAVGLGLSTTFSIVRRHGGHIRVDSKAGAGSTVYVYLPVAGKIS